MEIKYKVIYKSNNEFKTEYYAHLECAIERAERVDGIVLHA